MPAFALFCRPCSVPALRRRLCRGPRAQANDDDDARLTALEKNAKKRVRTADLGQGAANRGTAGDSQAVVWKEGSLLPENWDQLDAGQKAVQLYMGERGFLFWINKAAFAAAIGLGVLWVLFRIVGPALGLYTIN